MTQKLSSVQVVSERRKSPGPPVPRSMLSDIVRALARHRLLLFLSVSLLALASVLVFLNIQPKYTAQSTIMIYPREENVIDIEAVISRIAPDSQAVEGEIRVLQSPDLVAAVVDELGLQHHAEFNPAIGESALDKLLDRLDWQWLRLALGVIAEPDPESEAIISRTVAVERVLNGVQVEALGRSRVIGISATSEDPKLASTIANALATAYINFQVETKIAATQRAADWLAGRLESLRGEVEASERAVQNYRAEIVRREGRDAALLDRQIAETNSQLTLARAENDTARVRFEQIQDAVAERGILAVFDVVDPQWTLELEGLLVWLRQTESQLAARLDPSSTVLQDLRRQIGDSREQTARQLIAGARSALLASASKVEALQTALDKLLQASLDLGRAEVGLRSLERDASANTELFLAFLSRSKETAQVGFDRADAVIISRASVPLKPSWPRPFQFLLVAFVGSFVVGIGLVFLAEELSVGFLSVDDVAEQLQIRPLGEIPYISRKAWREDPASFIHSEPQAPFASAVRLLSSHLSLYSRKDGHEPLGSVIQFTSIWPGEGKSTIVAILARVAADSGLRVIAIDADLRRPTLHVAFDRARTPGLSDCIESQSSIETFIGTDEASGADVIVAGTPTSNVLQLLRSAQLDQLLANLRRQYDLVLVDSPPLSVVADAFALAHHVDSCILVVRAEATTREAVRSLTRRLQDQRIDLTGVVLNGVKTRHGRGYDRGYYEYRS